MTTQALHPDHLQPGHMVGPWRIVQELGRGGSSRVFKVERDGLFYAMKTALRPLSAPQEDPSKNEYVEEVSGYRRLAREAAALFTYSSHPNLLRVYAVDFWPHPSAGYPFIVTDYLDGDTWHQWRWRRPAHAAGLVDTFSDVVRTLGVLHARGVYHRDLKADNILIRRTDGRPFLIDFGTVRLPGALTQTMGVPEGVLHLLPPELLAYMRTEAWKRGVRFEGGVAADLYALGVLLYQALTDLNPFNPELPDKELLATIADTIPTAPHLLNPLAPRSLGDIAMKLLEKRPEDRYPNTEALLEALEAASEKERHSSAWSVPLTRPEEPLTQRPSEDGEEQRVPSPDAVPEVQEAPPPESPPSRAEAPQEQASPPARGTGRGRWILLVLTGLLLGAIGLLLWRSTLTSSPAAPDAPTHAQRGTALMPTTPQDSHPTRGNSLPSLITAWLCSVTSLGCPAAQLRPAPETCSQEARHNTFEVLKLDKFMELQAIIDINQPETPNHDDGIYHDGPIVGRVVQYYWSPPELPGGTLLYGRLWTGYGIQDSRGAEMVLGRYTEALLPDGRKLTVCIVIGGPDGMAFKYPGSQPGAVRMRREMPISAVWNWP
jgi:serine/threonine protein kinase